VLNAQSIPSPVGYVNDFANVIPAEDERAMQTAITEVVQKTPAEMAVVTVRSMAPYATIDEYGIALAEQWKVGSEDGDTGVILIVAVDERQVRIEVGYGLEGALPDGKVGGLLDDYIVPYLRNNDYGAGLLNGVRAVANVIAEEYGVTLSGVAATPERQSSGDGFDPFDIIYVLVVFFLIASRRFFLPFLFLGGRRRGFFGGGFGSSHRSSGGFSGFGGGGGGFSGGGFGGGGASRGF